MKVLFTPCRPTLVHVLYLHQFSGGQSPPVKILGRAAALQVVPMPVSSPVYTFLTA